MNLSSIRNTLQNFADPKRAINFRKFFKNSQNDIFLGVPTATIRKIAKEHWEISLQDILELMQSQVHDERSLAHAILCLKFRNSDAKDQAKVFKFYIKHRKYICDWDGVDDSAPYIVGPYLLHRDKAILYKLAKSKRIWDRRIAIVSTWWFIRNHEFVDTLKIAEILFQDQEDLIHKATGWMLREVGKRNLTVLKQFLKKHAEKMPRTTLRYAIERFSDAERKQYLIRSKGNSLSTLKKQRIPAKDVSINAMRKYK